MMHSTYTGPHGARTCLRLPLAVALPPRPFAAVFLEGPAASFFPAFPFFLAFDGPESSSTFAALLFVTVFAFSPFRGRFFCCFACAAVFIAFGPQKYLHGSSLKSACTQMLNL